MFKNRTIAIAVLSTLAIASSVAAAEELTIYSVASMSGAFANFGKQAELGSRLAIEERGEINGMTLKMVTVDTESNAGKAARKTKALVGKGEAKFFVGATLSSTALAVGKEVNKAGGVYINGGGADEITGSQCNKATFRWSAPTYGAVNASLNPVLDRHPEIKKVYSITPQYVFGEAMLENTKKVLEHRGLELVGNSYHSLKETEFSGYISQAMAAKPDLLILHNFGSLATNTIKQAVNFGLKQRMKILLVWSSGLDHLRTLGPKISEGIYFGSQYWHTEEAAANKSFVTLARKELNETPNYPMAHYYQMTKILLDSIAEVGTDPEKVRTHMEGLSYAGLTGDEMIRTEDHQVEKFFYLLEGQGEVSSDDDLAIVVSKEKYFLPHAETGCVMK